MWKPGDKKPVKEKEGPALSSSIKKNPTSLTKKKLSGSTMGMRFMQKQSNSHQQPTPKKSPKKLTENGVQDMQVDDDDSDSDEDEEIVTNSDMYGTQSDLIGRRSFGGFKQAIDNNWTESIRFMNGEQTVRENKHVSDKELLEKYQNMVKGRGPDHENNNSKKSNNKRKGSTAKGTKGKRHREGV
jgi:hypothetical protein